MTRLVLCLAAAIAFSSTVCAQDILPLAQITIPANFLFQSVYSDTNGFVAKANIEMSFGGPQLALPVTMQSLGAKSSTSFSLATFDSLPNEVRQSLRALSLDAVISVINSSTKRIDLIFPRVKGYVEMQASPKLELLFDDMEKKRLSIKRVSLGNETYQGFNCEKVRLDDPQETNVTVLVWERLDLNHFPMKIELHKDGVMRILVESVELKKPDAITLEAPKEFTRYATSSELVKAAQRAARTNAAAPVRDH